MSKTVRRRGFTLPEVLVTITIVAVLAAVVVPAVLNQVSKGDTAALAGDVGALRTAISNFTTDTRHYPANIKDLVTQISASGNDLMGVQYGTAAANAWKGPYFPTSQSITATGSYTTSAFAMTINSAFEAPSSTNANFITLVFGTQPAAANIATIDRLYDAGNGTTPTGANTASCVTPSAGSTTGNILWTEGPGSTPATDPCVITNLKWRLVSAAP
jgi:prepilin-type N-terminal cleavage/methylation domain-containing protein